VTCPSCSSNVIGYSRRRHSLASIPRWRWQTLALALARCQPLGGTQGAKSDRAAGAVFLAGIPLTSGISHVDLAADAQDALSAFLMDFNTPFALIFQVTL